MLPASPPVEPVTKIDVLGKSADQVAGEIISGLGDAPAAGCVLVLQVRVGVGVRVGVRVRVRVGVRVRV